MEKTEILTIPKAAKKYGLQPRTLGKSAQVYLSGTETGYGLKCSQPNGPGTIILVEEKDLKEWIKWREETPYRNRRPKKCTKK